MNRKGRKTDDEMLHAEIVILRDELRAARMRAPGPFPHIFRLRGAWVCVTRFGNLAGSGSTPRAAYGDWLNSGVRV